jgi:hypothetical protein
MAKEAANFIAVQCSVGWSDWSDKGIIVSHVELQNFALPPLILG